MPTDRCVKTLARVKKLIALSDSPNESEARNAAYQACRLIREHGFEVVGKDELKKAKAATITSSPFDFVPVDGWAPVGDADVIFCAASRFDGGKCKICGGRIHKGERIIWYRKEKKVVHHSCANDAATKRT